MADKIRRLLGTPDNQLVKDMGDDTYAPVIVVKHTASAGSAGAWTRITSGGLVDDLVVKATAGRVRLITGYSTLAQFLQVHNAASLPADTAVPQYTWPIEANKPFSFTLPEDGDYFSTGILVCNSTTGPTLTSGVDDTWITALRL